MQVIWFVVLKVSSGCAVSYKACL